MTRCEQNTLLGRYAYLPVTDPATDILPAARRISSALPGWRTARTSLRVLLVIHSAAAAIRLADLAPIFRDQRLQLFCTQTRDSMFPEGIGSFIQALGFHFLEWEQAVELEFNAVICASLGDNLQEITSPILRIPHGNGYNKLWPGAGSREPGAGSREPGAGSREPGAGSREPGAGSLAPGAGSREPGAGSREPGAGSREPGAAFGLSEETLMHDGRLVPAAIGLSHAEQFARLADGCPDAVPRAFIAGDPCYDRIAASLPRRLHYRRAFHLGPGQRLITVASTWREDSLFGTDPLLVSRMLSELPYDEYRIALVLHPNVWASHSSFQIRAWLAEALRAGLILLPPEEGWRAAVIAADWVVSDHGSVSIYAAAAGRPVLLEKSGREMIDPRSGLGRLLAVAPALDPHAPVEPQLRMAEELRERTHAVAADWVSSAPGRSLRLIRDELYRVMNAAPPDGEPAVLAVGSPDVDGTPPSSLWTQVEQPGADARELSVRRRPAAVTGPYRSGVLVAADDELDHRLLSQADIISTADSSPLVDEEEWSASVFGHRPGARLTLARAGRRACLRTRDGWVISLVLDDADSPDDAGLVFAVLAERFLTGAGDLAALSPLILRLGPARSVRADFRVLPH
jgi:hypothetical protein